MGDVCVVCDVWCVVCVVLCDVLCGVPSFLFLRAGGVLFKTRTQYQGVFPSLWETSGLSLAAMRLRLSWGRLRGSEIAAYRRALA